MPFVTSSFLLLVAMPGAPAGSVLVPGSDALVTSSFLLLVAMPGAPAGTVLVPGRDALCY